MSDPSLDALAQTLSLGDLLQALAADAGPFDILFHWQQGEFHHDLGIALREPERAALPGPVLVVSTNCNGGVKEVMAFSAPPERQALWDYRCGEGGRDKLAGLQDVARTIHWFDPCELLGDDARSEILPEHRRRQAGGGWELSPKGCRGPGSKQ